MDGTAKRGGGGGTGIVRPWLRGCGHLAACCFDLAEAEQDQAVLWLPVFLAAGVIFYYQLRFEPPAWAGLAVAAPSVAAALRCARRWQRGMAAAVAAAAIGFAAAQLATARAPPPEPALPRHAVEATGSIRTVEVLPRGRRITLDAVRLDDGPVQPRLVRIRLRNDDPVILAAGDRIRVRALIWPAEWPAYPGGWDLQRDAFFAGLGGFGYALGPVVLVSHGRVSAPRRLLERLREGIAARVSAAIPGSAGAFAVTLLTGFQNQMDATDHNAFRIAGLAHLLAVAGLHIGIVMGFAMLLARTLLAVSEHASLFWPTKKIAFLAALAAGGAYALLTGLHLPIQRSLLMASLFTLAVLAGRRAVSLRGLAWAAATLILIEPQEVPGVSFQMSFSAVLALISGYAALRPWLTRLRGQSLGRRLAGYVLALALTSTLAGTASAPYGAYHFGHIQTYFVIANMAAVPLTALWVMPLGLLSLPLMPFHLEAWLLRPMGWGAQAVVWVARTAASWPGATLDAAHAPGWGLAILSLGIAWLGLWRTRLRLLGVMAIVLGLVSPRLTRPPDLLVSAHGRLIAVRTSDGIWLQSAPGAAKFTRDAWLQYWASGPPHPMPVQGQAAHGAIDCRPDQCLLRPRADAKPALLVRGTRHPDACATAAIFVAAEPARHLCPKPWPKLVDRFTVWRDGAVAIWLEPGGAIVLTDRSASGLRPWVPPPVPRYRVRRRPAAPHGLVPATQDHG